MRRIRSILTGIVLGSLALSLWPISASALTEDNRTGPFKPTVSSPYRFGYSPKPNVLPGTKPKKKCVAHGLARCINRPMPMSPFAAQVHRQSWGADHPLIKRNQPFQPEPAYEVSE